MQVFKCIICEKDIESIHYDSLPVASPDSGMWKDGVVEKLFMPYGSVLDGDVYIFAICDDCIIDKHEKGLIGKKINNDYDR